MLAPSSFKRTLVALLAAITVSSMAVGAAAGPAAASTGVQTVSHA